MSLRKRDKAKMLSDLRDGHRTSRRSFLGTAAGALVAGASLDFVNSRAAAQAKQTETDPRESGGRVFVYPAHDSMTASPFTEISFRGVTRETLGAVEVAGSATGGHSGILKDHADGNGVSYLPDANFEPGERVTVHADVPLAPASNGALHFTVTRPAELPSPRVGVPVDAPKVLPHDFKSRPDLMPPVLDILVAGSQVAPGYVFVTAQIDSGQGGAMIVDNDGEPIWFGPPPVSDYNLTDFRAQSLNEQPVLTWYEGPPLVGGYGFGHYVICNASYERIAEFQVGNGFSDGGDLHEFVLTPRGTALVTIYHCVNWDLSPVGGSPYGVVADCIVQEVEIETGRVLFEWHSLDHIEVSESRLVIDVSSEMPFDYFQINSVQEDSNGDLVISARHTFAIYKVDRQTSNVIWRLNGTRNDFTMGPATEFGWQHSALVHPDGTLSLFDNHEADSEKENTEHSRGLTLSLDQDGMTATLLRQYVHPERLLATYAGNMQILANGNIFIGWGEEPAFSEFNQDGELIFDGRFPEGGESYRAFRHTWTGAPSVPPDVAVEITGQGGAKVYASWNGHQRPRLPRRWLRSRCHLRWRWYRRDRCWLRGRYR